MFEKIKSFFEKKINKDLEIEYWLNDPTLDLKDFYKNSEHVDGFVEGFKVNGYCGGGFSMNSHKGRAANCYVITKKLLNFFKERGFEIPNWPATNILNIYPLAGIDLNAYYDRKNIKLFYFFDYIAKKNIYLCESSDVVSHELGHAILDALRPDFWNVQSYEIWAIHESFSDIVAMLNILSNDKILKLIIKETNGNLFKSNTVSRLAEQFAKTLYNTTKGKYGSNPNFLRDAVNNFIYSDPINLPDEASENEISRECHSFGRIWTGCWYDILIRIYNIEKNNYEDLEALKIARDISAKYFIQSIIEVPCTFKMFESLSNKMMQIDLNNEGKYNFLLKNVFEKRNLIQGNIKNLKFQKFNHEKTKKIKILKNKKLENYFIEIPVESRCELGINGDVQFLSITDEGESVDQAMSCLNHLINTKKFKKLFKIKNKNIVRNKFIN
jgi:hypothetical protein